MKKNDVLELEIIDIGNNGEGIAKSEGLTIFIPFAMVGEVVEAHILKVNKNIAFAKINQVLSSSKFRVRPPCQYFAKCGGCDLQHICYAKQLEIKSETVKNALHKYAKIDCEVLPCFHSNKQFNYRNKMQFPCTINGIGMFAKNSHRVIEVQECPLSMPLCNKAFQIFKAFCAKTNQSLYDEENHTGLIRNVLLREVGEKVAVCIVINGNKVNQIEILIEMLKNEFEENFSLYLNINKKKNNTILSNETKCVFGESEIEANTLGIKYFISPNSFMQINNEIQNAIYSKVLDFVEEKDIVINAYSGAGLLSAILAKKAQKVYGIEIIEEATKNANSLMIANNIDNVVNITGDCSIELPKLIEKVETLNTALVLDPPRKGCEENILKAIVKARPSKIAYISCNPATLARDLETLKEIYAIQLVQPYDMFPQTKHVETLVLMEKRK